MTIEEKSREALLRIDMMPDDLLRQYPHSLNGGTIFVELSATPDVIYARSYWDSHMYTSLGVRGRYYVSRYRPLCEHIEDSSEADFDISEPLTPEMLDAVEGVFQILVNQVADGR